jgi:Mce-associated membrane protein
VTARIERLRRFAAPILAALMVVNGAWLWWDASSRRQAQTAAAESVQAAREAIVAMLSYRPESAEADLTAARVRLTGRFLDDYTQLITTVVIPEATGQKITSVVEVPAAASVSADSDRAVVPAFINQNRTVGKEKPALTRSSARVSLDRVDGRWLIAGFDPI